MVRQQHGAHPRLSAAMTRGEYPDLPAKLKKPVSFIAACHELARADQIGPDFITHLPCRSTPLLVSRPLMNAR